MYLQHNPSCFGAVHREKPLQDVDHELHWSVVVIYENYLIERRSFQLGRRFLDDQACSIPSTFNIAHEFTVYRARLSGLQDMLSNSLKAVFFATNHQERTFVSIVAKRCHFILTSKNKYLSDQARSPYDAAEAFGG
jgi:hypothetical protein